MLDFTLPVKLPPFLGLLVIRRGRENFELGVSNGVGAVGEKGKGIRVDGVE